LLAVKQLSLFQRINSFLARGCYNGCFIPGIILIPAESHDDDAAHGSLCVCGHPTIDNNNGESSCDMHPDSSNHDKCIAWGVSPCELSFQR